MTVKMDVKVDISEHARFMEKISVLGVATDDGSYKKSVLLRPSVKKRIKQYPSKVDKIHAILIYDVIKEDLPKYASLQMCHDISKSKLMNNLRKLLKDVSEWKNLESTKKIKISTVGNAFVDRYVKNVRLGHEDADKEITVREIQAHLRVFGSVFDEEE